MSTAEIPDPAVSISSALYIKVYKVFYSPQVVRWGSVNRNKKPQSFLWGVSESGTYSVPIRLLGRFLGDLFRCPLCGFPCRLGLGFRNHGFGSRRIDANSISFRQFHQAGDFLV